MGTRAKAQRNMGGIAIVVMIAMATMMVKRSWLSTPIASPMLATIHFGRSPRVHPTTERQRFTARKPGKLAPRKAPVNLPRLATAITAKVIMARLGLVRTVDQDDRPEIPKKTGVKNAKVRPRSCLSTCLLSIGDWPTSTPATNAPRTV